MIDIDLVLPRLEEDSPNSLCPRAAVIIRLLLAEVRAGRNRLRDDGGYFEEVDPADEKAYTSAVRATDAALKGIDP